MADLNKLFPGFESFMDGDIEINNEVTVATIKLIIFASME